jgi:hypothetical protein
MAEGSEAFNIREMPAIQGGWRIEDGGGAILNSPATIRSQFAMTADPTITPVGSVSRSRSSIIPPAPPAPIIHRGKGASPVTARSFDQIFDSTELVAGWLLAPPLRCVNRKALSNDRRPPLT